MRHSSTALANYRVHALHEGAGPHIVLLHGLVGSGRWWRFTMPALAAHFTVHAPDLIGFGRSRGAQPTIPEMAVVIREWMNRCAIADAHVVGHSMGAQIAIHLAAKHQGSVRRLVLVDAAGIPRVLTLPRAARFMTEIAPPRAWGSPAFLPTIAADALRAGPRVFARATLNLLRDDVRPLLACIEAPTLVIWGARDKLTPVSDGEVIASSIPNAELRVFRRSAHMPMIDEPERFNTEVLEFLLHD